MRRKAVCAIRSGRAWAVAAVVLALLVCVRIWWVNDQAVRYGQVMHEAGERVCLEGAFLESIPPEDTRGYSVRAQGVELMSYNDYVTRYATDSTATREGMDEKSVAVVELEIENSGVSGETEEENLETHALNMLSMLLTMADGSDYLVCNSELWSLAEEGVSPGQVYVSIRPHTSYVTHVPYTVNGSGDARYESALSGREFRLMLSGIPVRHVVSLMAA